MLLAVVHRQLHFGLRPDWPDREVIHIRPKRTGPHILLDPAVFVEEIEAARWGTLAGELTLTAGPARPVKKPSPAGPAQTTPHAVHDSQEGEEDEDGEGNEEFNAHVLVVHLVHRDADLNL